MPIEVVIEPPALKVYLAGPMSNLPESNYPAFFKAEQILREKGFDVKNPARNPAQKYWRWYMQQAIALMMQCDCLYLLPGWTGSRGAIIERNLAKSISMPIVEPQHWCPEMPDPWQTRSL